MKFLALVVIGVVFSSGAWSNLAEACSADVPLRHNLAWTERGLFVVAGAHEPLVLLDPAHRSVTSMNMSFSYVTVSADVTPQGGALVTLEEIYDEASASCEAAFVDVYVTDIRSGVRQRMARLRAIAAGRVKLSPSGAHVIVGAMSLDGEWRVHIFDLSRRRRVRLLGAEYEDAVWIEDARLAAIRSDGAIDVLSRERQRRASLIRVAPGTNRQLIARDGAGSAQFSVFEEESSEVVRYEVGEASVRAISRTRLPNGSTNVAIAPGEELIGFVNDGEFKVVRVSDGQLRFRWRTTTIPTRISFSRGADHLGLVSHQPLSAEQRGEAYDVSATQPIAVDVVTLADGELVAHWGVESRAHRE